MLTADLELSPVTEVTWTIPSQNANATTDDSLDHVRRPETCGHIWPPELYPDSQCESCYLPYGEWSI